MKNHTYLSACEFLAELDRVSVLAKLWALVYGSIQASEEEDVEAMEVHEEVEQ